MRSTHSQRLETWLGHDHVEHLSRSMRDWYGPPIAVQGVPGAVFACKGGDFIGHVDAGQFGSKLDRAEDIARRLGRLCRARVARGWKVRRSSTLYAGFASLSDLISEATTGKRREYAWAKTGVTAVVGACYSMWAMAGQPAAGAIGSAAPGGRATDDTTTGGMPIDNVSADTRHIVSGFAAASVANNLLLYDRIFDVVKNFNSATAESVTGVPTRYQSSTVTAADYAGGNFAFPEIVGTVLAATAHNHDIIIYRNQAGTDTISAPSIAGISACAVGRLDLPLNTWFLPLVAGDIGVMDLNSMKLSAAVATGTGDWVIGHPLAWQPCPIANLVCLFDYIGTAFNLVRIFDDACLAHLMISATATGAPSFNMGITAVHG